MKTLKTSGPAALALLLLLSLIAVAMMLTSCTGPRTVSQARFIQAVNRPSVVRYDQAAYDTVEILKNMGFAGVTILPNGTDTVYIKGQTRTIAGHATGWGPVPMTGLGIGYNDLMRLDSTYIRIKKGVLIYTDVK